MRRFVYSVTTGLALVACVAPAYSQARPKVQEDKNAPNPVFDISPEEAGENQNYNQQYRPQFHYTPIQGFVGDATGMVFDGDTYHLFYMSDKWERRKNRDKRWGYATTTDLLHWKEQPSVLDTVKDHHPGSGSGIVDWNNSLGLQKGAEKTLAVFYTDYGTGSCILYSTDGGKNWNYHPRNPVLPRVGSGDRDPLVFWYEPAKEWRLVRHWQPFDGIGDQTGFAFFRSTNLLDWSYLSKIGGFNECPDIFELPVDNNSHDKKWVLMDASFDYLIGSFNGTNFVPESKKLRADLGASSYVYACQSWKRGDAPPVQMAWLRYLGSPNAMPARTTWYGQMTFPCELTLKTVADGVRVCRQPVKAIEKLYEGQEKYPESTLSAGKNPLANLEGQQLDIQADIDLGSASAITMNIRGVDLRYSVASEQLTLDKTKAPLKLSGKRLRLRLLVDRSSLEIFAEEGQVSISRVFFFDPNKKGFSLQSEGGDAQVKSLIVHHLKSIWN
jgi:sucrose-6-phosphate hydrolase SacC (GH32 family)